MTSGFVPVSSVMLSTMAFHFPSASPTGSTSEHAAMAPAFTSGDEGRSFSSSSAMIELNGRPVASAPTLSSTSSAPYSRMARIAVGTFDTDSIPKVTLVSPTDITLPSGRHALMPNSFGSTFAR